MALERQVLEAGGDLQAGEVMSGRLPVCRVVSLLTRLPVCCYGFPMTFPAPSTLWGPFSPAKETGMGSLCRWTGSRKGRQGTGWRTLSEGLWVEALAAVGGPEAVLLAAGCPAQTSSRPSTYLSSISNLCVSCLYITCLSSMHPSIYAFIHLSMYQ